MPPDLAPPPLADVSVIIPAWQAAATIGRALASVAAQTVKPAEVVVVDDGSDDGTLAAAEAMRGALGAITLKCFRQDNQGAGAARNRALAEASCSLVAFLDADDEWLPEKLARSLVHLEGSNAALVAHNGTIVEDGIESFNDCARRFRASREPFLGLYERGYIDTCSVVARRALVLAAGGFDTTLRNAQDFDLFLAMLQKPGTPFVVFDDPLVRYHVTPGSIMSNTERRLACCLEIARRYVPALKARGGAWRSLGFRVLAIHYEAVQTYRARGEPGKAAWAALRALPALAQAGLWALQSRVAP